MLVRDCADSWQVVVQSDHADLSGQFAAAWGGGEFAPPPRTPSSVLAAVRHDDGWGVWDRRPGWDPDKAQPRAFLDVPVPVHLAFYRACIAAVTQEDAYAGMLISMHGAGIYTGRYGTQPSLGLSAAAQHPEEVGAFVAEQEAAYGAISAELGVGDDERWTAYKLLQVFDRLSLYFCLKDVEAGATDTLDPAPRGTGRDDAALAIEPVAPWHVRMSPFPFTASPARFTLVRRLLPRASYQGNERFRQDFAALEPETVQITIEEA